jgi:protoporphyrinogen oxidase
MQIGNYLKDQDLPKHLRILKKFKQFSEEHKDEIIKYQLNFEEFVETYFGALGHKVLSQSEHTDYFKADVFDTLAYYPADELFPETDGNKFYLIESGWHSLPEGLAKKAMAKGAKISLQSTVTKVMSNKNGCKVTFVKNKVEYEIECRQVIIGVTRNCLEKIQTNFEVKALKDVASQPFVKIYLTVDGEVESKYDNLWVR